MKKQESINNKSSVQDFADTLESNPAEIIAWAKREIKEYEALIEILEKKSAKEVMLCRLRSRKARRKQKLRDSRKASINN